MSRFNTVLTPKQKLGMRKDVTKNKAGGQSFEASPEMDLYLRACSGFLSDKYYSTASEQLTELRAAIVKTSPEYVVKLAAYVRNSMYLRTLPIVLLAEASREQFPNIPKGSSKRYLAEFAPAILKRPDDILELLSYLALMYGEGDVKKARIPNALKDGISTAFLRFDEYQLAKYNRKGTVTLADVVKLVHPKASDPAKVSLIGRLISNDLKIPDTWETYISKNGSNAQTWNAIAPKMGFMALLRNLRNFESKQATGAVSHAISVLSDPKAVAKSKQLPFRFLSAYRNIRSTLLGDAIHTAIGLSIQNVPKISDSMAVFVDTSGSMGQSLSDNSTLRYCDVASVLGGMVPHLASGEYSVYAFATNCFEVPVSKHDSVLTNAQRILETSPKVGYGTLAYKCIEKLIAEKKSVDLIISFSDLQCYGDGASGPMAATWEMYRRKVNPNAVLVSVDLAGYGGLVFPEDGSNVIQIAGWSEKIFDIISSFRDRELIVEKIKNTSYVSQASHSNTSVSSKVEKPLKTPFSFV